MGAAAAGSFWAPDQTDRLGSAPGMDAPRSSRFSSLLEGTETVAVPLDSPFLLAMAVAMPSVALIQGAGTNGLPEEHNLSGRSQPHGDLTLILTEALIAGAGPDCRISTACWMRCLPGP